MKEKFDFLKDRVNAKKLEKQRQATNKQIEEIATIAKNLINTKDYQIFKSKFFTVWESTLQSLLTYDEKDPVLYKIGVKEILTKIKVLEMFIKQTEGIAKEVKQNVS